MKILNKKGFFLVETVVVSAFVAGVLIFLFVQINTINRNYQRSFKYNTVNSLYGLNDIKEFLEENAIGGLTGLKSYTNSSTTYYLDLTTCPPTYVGNITYCQSLFNELRVTRVIMVKEDMTSLYNFTLDDNPETFDQNFKRFLNYVGSVEGSERFLLIACFNDETYAHLAIK